MEKHPATLSVSLYFKVFSKYAVIHKGVYPMSTSYPGGYDSYASKTDGTDIVMASHVNNLQDAIYAIEHELGINPKGSYATIAAAVAAMLDCNVGGTLHGNVACDSGVTIDGVDISELSGTAKKGSFWAQNAVNRAPINASKAPEFLVPGTGLTVDLIVTESGQSLPVEMDIAGSYQKVASATNISDLTASSTCYIYAEKGASDVPLFGHTTIEPTYSTSTPSAPASGLHWMDLAHGEMKRYNGADWVSVSRIFIGEAVTGASCTSATSYALRGFYDSAWFPVSANTGYTKNHNLGTYPTDIELCGATDSAGTQNVHRVGYFRDGGNGHGGLVSGITPLAFQVNGPSGFAYPIFYGSASATSGYYRLIARRGW